MHWKCWIGLHMWEFAKWIIDEDPRYFKAYRLRFVEIKCTRCRYRKELADMGPEKRREQ